MAEEGTAQDAGEFTVSLENSVARFRGFQEQNPGFYLLKWLQGAVASGTKFVNLSLQRQSARLSFYTNHPLRPEPFLEGTILHRDPVVQHLKVGIAASLAAQVGSVALVLCEPESQRAHELKFVPAEPPSVRFVEGDDISQLRSKTDGWGSFQVVLTLRRESQRLLSRLGWLLRARFRETEQMEKRLAFCPVSISEGGARLDWRGLFHVLARRRDLKVDSGRPFKRVGRGGHLPKGRWTPFEQLGFRFPVTGRTTIRWDSLLGVDLQLTADPSAPRFLCPLRYLSAGVTWFDGAFITGAFDQIRDPRVLSYADEEGLTLREDVGSGEPAIAIHEFEGYGERRSNWLKAFLTLPQATLSVERTPYPGGVWPSVNLPFCAQAVGLRMQMTGPGQLFLVRDGILMEPVEEDLGVEGAFAMLPADGLDSDLSGFQVVKNEAYQEKVDGLRQDLVRLSRTVRLAERQFGFLEHAGLSGHVLSRLL